MTRTVLVTGATGFLGSHVARQLTARGDDVRVLARPTSVLDRLDGLPIELHYGDVTDRASVFAAASGADGVIHCAATIELGATDLTSMFDINVGGTLNVLEAAEAANAVAVHVSSVSALGDTGTALADESWWNEDQADVGYYRVKREAHVLARQLAERGARVRIGIPGGIYGTGDESELGATIKAFVSYGTPLGYSKDLLQSLVNVDDCADGLVRILDDGIDGREYILCAEPVTMDEWFAAIAVAGGKRPPRWWIDPAAVNKVLGSGARLLEMVGVNPGQLQEISTILSGNQSFSGQRMRTELGWAPRDLQQGMDEMAEDIWMARLAAKRAKAAGRRSGPAGPSAARRAQIR